MSTQNKSTSIAQQDQEICNIQQDIEQQASKDNQEKQQPNNNSHLKYQSDQKFISISRGQKNVFINNLKGIKGLELKYQIQAKHNDDAFCLTVLDNQYLAIGSTDATITIYNLKNDCKLVRKINYYYEPILILEPLRLFHKTLLLSTGYDQIINVWDYLSGKKITDLEACGCEITKLCDNLDKNLIVGSTFDGRIILWSYTNKRIVNVLKLRSQISNQQRLIIQEAYEDLIQTEMQQIEGIGQEDDDLVSEMDLESHGSIYSLHQIQRDSYLVLQRGCISEIKIVASKDTKTSQNAQETKSKSQEILIEEIDQENNDNQIQNKQNDSAKINYEIQVLRQFQANQDAIQFNLIPFENQKIITLGTKRGFIFLYDFDTGEVITSKKTLSGAVNEILTIQTMHDSKDHPFVISTSHTDRFLKIESLKTGDSFRVEDDRIFCYNECMNSKMQFFKNRQNELFIAVICQEHQNPYFSIFKINLDYYESQKNITEKLLNQ
ncbi:hypothetical protein TTHERM_00678190 (macronuclear) [Tetrahymena thermophila SB210]|uniref:Uncharacterized protein n=1 Tax=Tetrahymena thermophila (strain SB210) TaxID=312017 RepID=I7MJW0_TETTS|nr:hypothetical protein TTHERM_00678190 [Tetrahymena thermophila SB210]EAS07553.2 hypothetical protein TTHERM_00678190 [Tetrahymena thermophila SB210]|eukprot:XP_001027795.2 hypothetical protein TTHERM_00678190 [Tetrahymena thermophila SB210]